MLLRGFFNEVTCGINCFYSHPTQGQYAHGNATWLTFSVLIIDGKKSWSLAFGSRSMTVKKKSKSAMNKLWTNPAFKLMLIAD